MQRLSQGCPLVLLAQRELPAPGSAHFHRRCLFCPQKPVPAGGLSRWNELCEQSEFGSGVSIPAAGPGRLSSASACLCWSQVHPRTGEAWRGCRNHQSTSPCSGQPGVAGGGSCRQPFQLPRDAPALHQFSYPLILQVFWYPQLPGAHCCGSG